MVYPVKGRHVSHANKNVSHDVIYEFEVESVRRLTEGDKTKWVPEWPTGTIVRDFISDKNIEIRHTNEQILERQDEYYDKLGVDREIKPQGRRNWIMLIINLVGIALILFLAFKNRRAKQKNNSPPDR